MDNMILLGIGFGLGMAVFQSLSYLCIRLFNKRHDNSIITLLALSHILMGVASIPLAAWLWPEPMPPLSQYGLNLLASAGFYLLGQFFLFSAIIHSEPSRVAPMLGLKVLMLSLIGIVFLGARFGAAQWLAVLFTTAAVFLLSWTDKRIERRFVILGVLACLSYCVSDTNIKFLVDHFDFMGALPGASLATALCYILCGLVGVVIVLIEPGHSTRATWLYAVPFATSWFIAMICLFSCFGLIGVVFGNILQSMRGIISIGLGFVIAHLGFETLEPKSSKRIIIQRIAAAILMTTAVILFLI
jgi:drug/metabolite transporter (DMT)-like permease